MKNVMLYCSEQIAEVLSFPVFDFILLFHCDLFKIEGRMGFT